MEEAQGPEVVRPKRCHKQWTPEEKMELVRFTYYFELGRQGRIAIKNMPLMNQIKDIFAHHKGRYGVRRVYHELVNRGYSVNHKRVQRNT
ncbi:IS3 family transposase [Veillonella magna]|uniref:IS3 family transposase n=1 Tax=Veillonella magna TaxID=464322 RepID=UPI003F58A43F